MRITCLPLWNAHDPFSPFRDSQPPPARQLVTYVELVFVCARDPFAELGIRANALLDFGYDSNSSSEYGNC
jgi:hypothetical protein